MDVPRCSALPRLDLLTRYGSCFKEEPTKTARTLVVSAGVFVRWDVDKTSFDFPNVFLLFSRDVWSLCSRAPPDNGHPSRG